MKTLLLALLLAGSAVAEPVLFLPQGAPQGRVVLVAEDGTEEARALARCGLTCALTHASNPGELEQEVCSASTQLHGAVTVIALANRAPLLSSLHYAATVGLIGVDAHPSLEAYKFDSFDKLAPTPSHGAADAAQPSFLVAPDADPRFTPPMATRTPVAGSLTEDNSPLQREVRRLVAVQQPLPVVGLPGATYVQSPNWGVRSLGDRIDTVVVHSTVIDTLEGTERAFLDDKVRRVSAHYVVDRDGTVVQMVDERRTAWHAGVSEFDGRTGVNDFSVGVELVNLNDGKDPYPEAQLQSLVRIIKDLRTRWPIADDHIVSHEFVARPPGRKNDPKGFDFEDLKKRLKQ